MLSLNVHNFFGSQNHRFNIIEEFAGLNARRKLALCDRLYCEGQEAYRKTVRALWPQASSEDMNKLEKFLLVIKKPAH